MNQMKRFNFPFDPHAQLDFQFKWDRWCAGVNDSLADHTVTVDAGLSVVSSVRTANTITVYVRLDSTTPAQVGQRPQIHCDITTASSPPRRDRRSAELLIVAR